jgi:hypothetical protein
MEQSVDDDEEWVLVKVWMQQVINGSVNWSLQFFSYSFDDLVDVVLLFST